MKVRILSIIALLYVEGTAATRRRGGGSNGYGYGSGSNGYGYGSNTCSYDWYPDYGNWYWVSKYVSKIRCKQTQREFLIQSP